jgi:3-hydroxyacyl-CoA dehydrogenase/enoyl-CoA hydratase/3-hydroxybutyryl-CoA epimerase
MTAPGSVKAAFTNLRLELDDDVAVVTIDVPNKPVNTLNAGVIAEFGRVFEFLEGEPSVRGAVLISGKADNFIAGADIEQFLTLKSAKEAEALSRAGQELVRRLETLRVPVVAAINGACLGGGL